MRRLHRLWFLLCLLMPIFADGSGINHKGLPSGEERFSDVDGLIELSVSSTGCQWTKLDAQNDTVTIEEVSAFAKKLFEKYVKPDFYRNDISQRTFFLWQFCTNVALAQAHYAIRARERGMSSTQWWVDVPRIDGTSISVNSQATSKDLLDANLRCEATRFIDWNELYKMRVRQELPINENQILFDIKSEHNTDVDDAFSHRTKLSVEKLVSFYNTTNSTKWSQYSRDYENAKTLMPTIEKSITKWKATQVLRHSEQREVLEYYQEVYNPLMEYFEPLESVEWLHAISSKKRPTFARSWGEKRWRDAQARLKDWYEDSKSRRFKCLEDLENAYINVPLMCELDEATLLADIIICISDAGGDEHEDGETKRRFESSNKILGAAFDLLRENYRQRVKFSSSRCTLHYAHQYNLTAGKLQKEFEYIFASSLIEPLLDEEKYADLMRAYKQLSLQENKAWRDLFVRCPPEGKTPFEWEQAVNRWITYISKYRREALENAKLPKDVDGVYAHWKLFQRCQQLFVLKKVVGAIKDTYAAKCLADILKTLSGAECWNDVEIVLRDNPDISLGISDDIRHRIWLLPFKDEAREVPLSQDELIKTVEEQIIQPILFQRCQQLFTLRTVERDIHDVKMKGCLKGILESLEGTERWDDVERCLLKNPNINSTIRHQIWLLPFRDKKRRELLSEKEQIRVVKEQILQPILRRATERENR